MHDDLRIGSLFSGYGGLDLGMQQVFGGSVAWHVEFDPAPSAILHHHWPDVPNYGDVTAVDWESVEPVDILTGGFPCQDVSLAGLRRGLKDGTRSGLWSEFARAIDVLRPSFVVIENVRGLLSATADRQMESSPWGVGDRPDGPALRALGAVLGDLADLGYDAEWCGLRAADAGAPHGRYRVFVLAFPANADDVGQQRDRVARSGRSGSSHDDRPAQDTHDSARRERGVAASGQAAPGRSRSHVGGRGGTSAATNSGGDRFRIEPTSHDDDRPVALGNISDRRATPDADNRGRDGRPQDQIGFSLGGASASGGGRCSRCGEPTEPTREDIFLGSWCECAPADPYNGADNGQRARSRSAFGSDRTVREWGEYGAAVRRWEFVTGRVAPSPTNPDGKHGAHRLSAEFVEWMMGLPAGHVTEAPVTRTQKLKALGNGVVPQQAALAVRTLLDRHIASRNT